jgi:hypothetical protein
MIIGLCGQAGVGKDTVADFLVKNNNFVKVAFADPLKRICRDVFDFSNEQLWGPSAKRNEPDLRYRRALDPLSEGTIKGMGVPAEYAHPNAYLTPRYALQILGTEWGRACYPNIWVEYALRIASGLLKKYIINESIWRYDSQRGLYKNGGPGYDPQYPTTPSGIVIPDVRFINEVDAIRKAGGFVWKIERPVPGLEGAAGQHASEQEQNSIDRGKFASALNNHNGPLDDLEQLVGKELSALRFIYPDQEK